jgi:hypothetical protein
MVDQVPTRHSSRNGKKWGRSTTSQTIVVGFTFLSFFGSLYIYIHIIHRYVLLAGHPRLAMYMGTNLSEETL